jgi:hypothetical protein
MIQPEYICRLIKIFLYEVQKLKWFRICHTVRTTHISLLSRLKLLKCIFKLCDLLKNLTYHQSTESNFGHCRHRLKSTNIRSHIQLPKHYESFCHDTVNGVQSTGRTVTTYPRQNRSNVNVPCGFDGIPPVVFTDFKGLKQVGVQSAPLNYSLVSMHIH